MQSLLKSDPQDTFPLVNWFAKHPAEFVRSGLEKYASKDVGFRKAYMHVPNFGRVQVMLTNYPDGTSYPLVTLPKMTPYDILKVLDKQEEVRRRSWTAHFLEFVHRLSCGVL